MLKIWDSPVVVQSSNRPAPVTPPPSPIWYPSVMGTGILANLLALHSSRIPLGAYLALGFLIICWSLLVFLTVGFLCRTFLYKGVLRDALVNPAIIPFWGTVSMGFLSAGAAAATVTPIFWPTYVNLAWQVNTITWIIGVIVGVLSGVSFATRAFGTGLGQANFVWGLAVVGPMVSATVGANLSPHVSPVWGPLVLVLAFAGFLFTLSVGTTIFTQGYVTIWGRAPLPLAASASSWIPLGLVGQSAAAAQAIAFNLENFTDGSLVVTAHWLANVYGWVTVFFGLPLTLWAAFVTIRGVRLRMPFTPGWWATTFPIGTLALGATWMARGTGLDWLVWVGTVGTLALMGTVLFSGLGSLRAVVSKKHLL